MYLSQEIDVNLVSKNVDILNRPSRVFNKLKSLFSGEMTPTEQAQAEVMLSVLQRINIALRNSRFDNLVSIDANGQVLYQDEGDTSGDLAQGNDALVAGLRSAEVKRVDSLSLTVDGRREMLRFQIRAVIVRRPEPGNAPLKLRIVGFISDLEQKPDESDEDHAVRVTEALENNWAQNRSGKVNALEQVFNTEVSRLKAEIDSIFPAGSVSGDLRKVVREKQVTERSGHGERFSHSYGYLPIWFTTFEDAGADDDEVYEMDDFDDWGGDDDDSTKGQSSSGWVDDMSDFGSGDVADGGGCGSGCGGGCGS